MFGDFAVANRALLHVTGFDSASQAFTGTPLGRFGTPAGLAPGSSEPVRLAVSMRIPLGPSITSQRAEAALRTLDRDSSARGLSRAAMEYLGDLPPIPIMVLQAADGIQLTADQRGALQVLAGRWQESAASTVAGAVRRDAGAARTWPLAGSALSRRERLEDARAMFLEEVRAIAAQIRQLLSPDQIDLLPDGVQRVLNPRFLRFVALQDAATM